tara:strand:- start:4086 stop:4283 length:198 start_codon:yes stop_codon:yes gene_type:complete
VKQAAGKIGPSGIVAMINVDQNPEAARAFQVRGIPHLVVIKNGQKVEQIRPDNAERIAAAFQKHF